jgi:D-alanyl-D-alanine carboxypeptidase
MPRPTPAPEAEPDETCDRPADLRAAAQYNAAASINLAIAPFGRSETGWALYGPQIAELIKTRCAPDTPGFAEALSHWQTAHGLIPDGVVTDAVFQVFKGVWQERRPFVMLRVAKICPAGADEATLEALRPDETLGDKIILLRPAALAALRRMAQAARSEVAETRDDPDLLKAFSGYRSPVADDARCEREKNCQGMVRAQCSVHRTGLAVDLNVGFAPGFMADSTVDANRLYQTRTATYRWLVRNAARFGFVNYVFEPWHWEWTGEAL